MRHQYKRRVCCFCETWESGGIESFLYNVLMRMDLTRLEVDLVAAEIRESIFTDELKKRGIHFYELSGNTRHLLQNWITFRKLLSQRKYDVVHFNIFHGLSLVYAQLAKYAGIPIRIVHSHGAGLRSSRTKWLKLWVHQCGKVLFSNAATDRWACSSLAATFLFSRQVIQRQDFQWIPNGIETAHFRFQKEERKKIREELGFSHNFVIGHVGRLAEEKNQSFLLEIFTEVHKHCPTSRLLLIGTGNMIDVLHQRVKELGIRNQVRFYGVSNQIPNLLWGMDAFVFPSLFEGLGIAAVEAQAAGLPVFCSEQVPNEAHVTSQFYKVSLKASPSLWAEMILSHSLIERNREKGAEQVRRAGFEIDDVTRTIEAAYWGRRH